MFTPAAALVHVLVPATEKKQVSTEFQRAATTTPPNLLIQQGLRPSGDIRRINRVARLAQTGESGAF